MAQEQRTICPHDVALRYLAASVTLAFLAQGPASAGEVVIVLSGKEAPYAAAQDEAAKRLGEQGCRVTTVQMTEVTKDTVAARKVDVYLAVGTKAAVFLHDLVKPPAQLVYCMVSQPAKAGLTEGAAASGICTDVPLRAQFELIRKAMSGVKTIGMLYRADTPASEGILKEAQQALPKDLRLVSTALDKHDSVAEAIENLLAQKPDIIWTAPDPSVYEGTTVKALLLASIRGNTPVFGFSAGFVKAGALMGIGVDPRAQGEQAAAMTASLLGRTTEKPTSTPADAHVVEPPKFQIVLNLIVADRLSISLPAPLIETASQVVKPQEEKP
jgi:ABC-type uncharacterized transport system substrate-binding protein